MPTRQRQKGTGSLFQRSRDGMWLGQIDLGFDAAGKRRRKTVSNRSKAVVQRRLIELQKQFDAAGDVPVGSQTVKAWTDYWLEKIAAPRVRPRTLAGYRGHVAQYIVPAIGRVRLDKLGPQHARVLRSYVLDKGLSSTTARHAHVTLVKILSDAHREGVIARNPAALVDAPKRAVSRRGALSAQQGIDLLLATERAKDPLLSRWAMALLTGQRQGECLGLEIERVHDDRLDISWQLQRMAFEHGCDGTCGTKRGGNCPQRRHVFQAGFEYRETADPGLFLTRPKTHERVIPLVEPFRSALLTHINGRTSGLVWNRSHLPPPKRPSIAHRDGWPIDSKMDNQAWHDALKSAGLPSVTLHEARHTTATLLLEAGVDPKVIGQILGQSSVLTTQGYQHVSLALATDAMRALGRALTGSPSV